MDNITAEKMNRKAYDAMARNAKFNLYNNKGNFDKEQSYAFCLYSQLSELSWEIELNHFKRGE